MASSVYFQKITSSLQRIDEQIRKEPPMTVTSSSQVSSQNPHRKLLEAVRTDLMHYDYREKHHRIVYTIEEYLYEHPNEDSELIDVLKRILEVVECFQKNNELMFTPEKQNQALLTPANAEALREKSRELYRLLNEQS